MCKKHNFFKIVVESGAEIINEIPGQPLRKPKELGSCTELSCAEFWIKALFKKFLVKFNFASSDASDLAKLLKYANRAYFARSLQDQPSIAEVAQFVAHVNELLQ